MLPCKIGDKLQYIDSDKSMGFEVVEKIVVEVETDGGIYSVDELKPEDFKEPKAAEDALKASDVT